MISHSKPTLGKEEKEALDEVLRSAHIAQGPKVEEFERSFAAQIGMPDAVAVNSGTSGLHLALCALGIGQGDEVLLPSYVCCALLNAVHYVGATPVLVDSMQDHGHMDSAQALEKISKKTKAVILVHLFGDVTTARAFRQAGLRVVEDATQSLGNHVGKDPVGSLGDLSVFSFYATKIITTGEGGMIGVRDTNLAKTLRDLRDYDEKKDPRTRYNYKMTDMAAAMGMAQLQRLSQFLEHRKRIASRYDAAMANDGLRPCNQKDSIFYRYVAASAQGAEGPIEAFIRRGVQCKRPVHQPIHRLLGLGDAQFPRASVHHARNLSIPIYPSLQDHQVQAVCQAMTEMRHVEIL